MKANTQSKNFGKFSWKIHGFMILRINLYTFPIKIQFIGIKFGYIQFYFIDYETVEIDSERS